MLSNFPLLLRTQRVTMTIVTTRPHMVIRTAVPVLGEELHCLRGPGSRPPHSAPASTHRVTSTVEAGDRRRRLELVSPRLCDISTVATWFRVMLPSEA